MKKRPCTVIVFLILAGSCFADSLRQSEEKSVTAPAKTVSRPVNKDWYKEFIPPNTSHERIPYQNRYGRGSNRHGVGFTRKKIYPGQYEDRGEYYDRPSRRVFRRRSCGRRGRSVVVRRYYKNPVRRSSCSTVVRNCSSVRTCSGTVVKCGEKTGAKSCP